MYVDFKITVWERIKVPKEIEKLVLNKIKKEEILSTNEMFGGSDKLLLDTSKQMTPGENDGFATIEVFNDKSEVLFANGKY